MQYALMLDSHYLTTNRRQGSYLTVRPMLSDRCLSCLPRWYIVAKRLDGSWCHLVRRWASVQATLC